MALLPVEEALARLLASAQPLQKTEDLPLAAARGRILAAPVTARLTQPPFDASAMDGYALRATDAAEPGAILELVGESAAGHGFDGTVQAGQCVRIFTGAPMPAGADTVLLQEDAEKMEDGRVLARIAVPLNRHIRPRGQDFAEGDQLLTPGTQLDFRNLTLAAAANQPTLTVYRKPLLAILATGDELVLPGARPGASQIIASNTFGIAALAEENGADVLDLGLVKDDRAAIADAVRRAQQAGADVLVTVGGASVGDHDLVGAALQDAGMVLDFWKIAMRPGKPLMVGRLECFQEKWEPVFRPETGENLPISTPVLGLPGNPVSSMVCSLLFLEPLLAHLGHRQPPKRLDVARSAVTLKANDQRQDYLRGRLTADADGAWVAEPFGKQDSSMTRILASADCLIIRPPHAPELPAGNLCPILRIGQL
ncbi:molybdopterin molybdotransferase MoeA [Rhizobium paknamense]|uniref:Molybdopterin molybdenumtransferase n=1 Tax=Rhizobium paknamense TaxID=1206817 RepID=A0ABU0ICF8_9HYPH|nr:gephyrin-like molybdotransferase Glp [Rhizobium paknamense]MDQ0455927.1 molybdopterin molybdotransferase [Rhizobium paknamense]